MVNTKNNNKKTTKINGKKIYRKLRSSVRLNREPTQFTNPLFNLNSRVNSNNLNDVNSEDNDDSNFSNNSVNDISSNGNIISNDLVNDIRSNGNIISNDVVYQDTFNVNDTVNQDMVNQDMVNQDTVNVNDTVNEDTVNVDDCKLDGMLNEMISNDDRNDEEELNDSIFNISSQLKNQKISQPLKIKSKKDYSNVVENIIGEKKVSGKTYYKLKFYGQPVDENSWTLKEDISDYTLEVFSEVNKHNNEVSKFASQNNKSLNTERAYIYARTSNDNDTSIETQKKYCFDFCKKNNILVNDYSYDCGVSGGYNNKTNIMNNLNYELGFLTDIINDNSLLIVHSIDRLGRSTAGVAKLFQDLLVKNISIIFVKENIVLDKDTPSQERKMILQQVIDAEHLSHLTREKTKRTRDRLISEGHFLGRPSYGFKVIRDQNGIRKKVINKDEAMNIKAIKLLHNSLRYSPNKYNLIAVKLNGKRLKYSNGKTFNKTNVAYLIKKYDL